ncbi:SusC/RagA family TonB-linked outer membrane protein [Chitinophaga sedimenti]|nr:SusC/RagA family TonB-linked outer membrane protein [Chitinophaga sedimenti]MCK7556453.1 SusC/RagA family TonB-linked outer membrane protein [Chitinophaga sedimenti]
MMLICLWTQKAHSQASPKITGTVVDSTTGEKLPNVTIAIVGTLQGLSSNAEGFFELDISRESVALQFSMVGYVSKILTVKKGTPVVVRLAVSANELDEVAIVAFGRQKKSSMVSAITTIDPKDLKVPSSNLTTALAGRLAGVIAYQRTGEPGQDNASFFIRGVTTFGYKKDPLIMMDGVEVSATDLARMQPDDIASFSIMRDATATALYGARGANGVILVTTKSGKEGPVNISVRFENSTSSNTKNVQLADPITYMRLENEAVLTRNRLGVLPYSQNKIDNTIAGTNPYIYPANDWMEQLLKKSTTNQRLNFNASGGGKVARYYIAGTYNQDNGILQVEKLNNFNSNIKLKTYQLRSNVNINMTKSTEVIVRLTGTFDDYRGPIDGGAVFMQKLCVLIRCCFLQYIPPKLCHG